MNQWMNEWIAELVDNRLIALDVCYFKKGFNAYYYLQSIYFYLYLQLMAIKRSFEMNIINII